MLQSSVSSGCSSFLQLPFQHPPSDRSKQTDGAEPNGAFLPVDSKKMYQNSVFYHVECGFWVLSISVLSPLIHKAETVIYIYNFWKF